MTSFLFKYSIYLNVHLQYLIEKKCFVAFYIGPSSQDDLIVMPDLLLMLYMVSMLSMPPHATRLPLGEKAEVITHADFRGITYVMKHKVLRFYNT